MSSYEVVEDVVAEAIASWVRQARSSGAELACAATVGLLLYGLRARGQAGALVGYELQVFGRTVSVPGTIRSDPITHEWLFT